MAGREEKGAPAGSPPRAAPPRGPAPVEDHLPPALFSGTSQEYIGQRPLPRTLRERPLVVITGPVGVGKTRVALQLAGEGGRRLDTSALHRATVDRVRRRAWPATLLEAGTLVIDGPVFLGSRPAAARALQELVRARVDAGLRTLVCEGDVRDGSIALLMDAVPPESRATLMLRFPVGRGRVRFCRRLCVEIGLSTRHERAADDLDPWSYEGVRLVLERIRVQEPPVEPTE